MAIVTAPSKIILETKAPQPSFPDERAIPGRAIRALRKRLGWTQTDLANHLGVALRTVQQYEHTQVRYRPPVWQMLRSLDRDNP